ncbi:MAG: lipopolysaccharide biosynthesis protein [Muribaculaceae bacterium]
METGLKTRTAGAVKWNVIDKVSQQLLYAVTGIVLARLLDQEDFGLIGAVLVFQAFASLFVDSGFSYALIQRKSPTRLDYSTVLWFNLGVATSIYAILFFSAPLIADCFQGDRRIIPISRVMFLGFILNATAIVQTNRLMKKMDVRMVAVSNAVGLFAGAVVGIWLAVAGYGAWAIVWQTLALNLTKSLVLWLTSGWLPLMRFSWRSLKSFFAVGSGMMVSSFLNVLFQNIYSFFIGNRAGLAPLGYYTQADKWSKMGISSLSQVLTSSFLPALSAVQDDPERFARVTSKMNRFTSYLLFPAMGFLAVMATPVFHCLFGEKWDASIVLFQLLLARGIFTVLTSLYNNYVIALARTRLVVAMEVLRDGAALLLLFAALPFISMERGGDVVYGIKLLLAGQILASAISWGVMVVKTAPVSGRSVGSFLADSLPYLCETLLIMAVLWGESLLISDCWKLLVCQGVTCIALYVGINALLNSVIQREVFAFLRGKKLE